MGAGMERAVAMGKRRDSVQKLARLESTELQGVSPRWSNASCRVDFQIGLTAPAEIGYIAGVIEGR